MFAQLFRATPLIDAARLNLMQQVHAWALRQFGAAHFNQQIRLILPTNAFFPERVSNVDEMAASLAQRMAEYAGLAHWPLAVSTTPTTPQLPAQLPGPQIGASPASAGAPIELGYNPQQASDPQAMIASHAQQLGALLLALAAEPPPLDEAQQPVVAELLAVYLGFGIQLANSAFRFAGGCGGCRGSAGRVAYLNQDEALMALALFCQHKGIAARQVTPHLQRHLRGIYRRGEAQLRRAD